MDQGDTPDRSRCVEQLRSSLVASEALISQERREAEATEAKHAEELRDSERQLEVVKGRARGSAARGLAEQQLERSRPCDIA